ncbi:hypothetical protein [Streptomyces resistomycificus]|uniref:Membrane protein n=1 Tax=Streptomyces resistomycificus TaxID=67356 RepID=A0A0L8L7L5_9ACTN|nr:hypothetical protein [Streptomyces resistomycificus]KOG34076.1 membrane protein [Streptomyces resistomycificus]KUN92989.1 hypothetical protein AQJ84_30785 [Streptomyces resistomycificus]
MPDRSLRLLTLLPQSSSGGVRSGVLLRERPTSPPDAPSDRQSGDGQDGRASNPAEAPPSRTPASDDNPFAPPPEGTPDQPWQPRRPAGGEGGDGSDGGQGDGGRGPWGNQWSDRQPGRGGGGFGERPGAGPEGQGGGGGGKGPAMRWDPTDPAQRRARYALLSGMWAFFFALFSWPYVALMLGALAMYWAISALRAKPGNPGPDTPAPAQSGRPQRTAAISGLVTASLAIVLVAAGFTVKLVYSDYYTCTNDALTNTAKQSCEELLPKELRGVLGASS